jgi:hypothetical protein
LVLFLIWTAFAVNRNCILDGYDYKKAGFAYLVAIFSENMGKQPEQSK